MEVEVTTAEAALIMGVTPRHVRWYHTQGLLHGRQIGEAFSKRPPLLVFRRADVEAFVKPKKTGRPKAGDQAAVKRQRKAAKPAAGPAAAVPEPKPAKTKRGPKGGKPS
jgi:hypothetical protein